MQTLGTFLKQLRQDRKISLSQLALRAGVNKATVSRWESDRFAPRIPELSAVLDVLDVSATVRADALRRVNAPRAVIAARNTVSTATMLSTGDLLYGLRTRSGKTQAEAARAVGVSRSLYAQWENDSVSPSDAQRHETAFALGASAEEAIALSTYNRAIAPVENTRDAYLQAYLSLFGWEAGVTGDAYELHLLSLLAHFGRLFRAGKADASDLALIVSDFGSAQETLRGDWQKQGVYYRRALALAKRSSLPLHAQLVAPVRGLLHPQLNPKPFRERLSAALEWLPLFGDNTGKAFLFAAIAAAIAPEAPNEALQMGDKYCELVADNPAEYLCRLRDKGNLLRHCGRPAESVAFIASLMPQDAFRAGLQKLEMAQGLTQLGSLTEARLCLTESRQGLAPFGYAPQNKIIADLERRLA